MTIDEVIERIEEVMQIIKAQHMCKSMDGECTKEDVEDYKARFEALKHALDTLKLKKELIEEIPTFKHILNAQYEIFYKYKPFDSHTDIELIAWSESGRIMQDIQWLLDRLGAWE